MPSNVSRLQTPSEGISVIGEAARRVQPENAEFLLDLQTTAPTAAQALRDNQSKSAQLAQLLTPLGVAREDVQTSSQTVNSLFTPGLPSFTPLLPAFGMPQLGQTAFSAFSQAPHALQPEVGFDAFLARTTLRVIAKDAARVGEILEVAHRAGATLSSGFSFRAADEPAARRAALEAAARDARSKAEALATATGKQLGDPISIAEDVVVSNGAYAALRSVNPIAFGSNLPVAAGELEYYARVSASYRFQ